MSLPSHLDAYEDCLDYFEKALADPSGIRISFDDYGQANLFTMRMHQCRALHRALHRRVYAPDDHRHGRSEFDKLMVRQPRYDDVAHWWVYVERADASVVSVESLTTLYTEPLKDKHDA
jgi:hypothetical protein